MKKITVTGICIIIILVTDPEPSKAVDFPIVEGFTIERLIRRPREIVEAKVQSFLDAIPRPDFEEIEEAVVDKTMNTLKRLDAKLDEDEEKRADEMYEEIRASDTDVVEIAKNTGYKEKTFKNAKIMSFIMNINLIVTCL